MLNDLRERGAAASPGSLPNLVMLAGPELETLLFVTDDAEESAGLVDRGLFVDLLGWHLGRVASEGAELH